MTPMTAISVDLDVELLLDEIVSMEIACEAEHHGTHDIRPACGCPAMWVERQSCPLCGWQFAQLVCNTRRLYYTAYLARTNNVLRHDPRNGGCGQIGDWGLVYTRIPERS